MDYVLQLIFYFSHYNQNNLYFVKLYQHEKFYLNATLLYLVNEYDVLFYVSPEGVEIEDNGVRETNAEYREAIDKKIKSIVGMYRGDTITISGTVKERIEQVKNAVAQYV